MLKAGVPNPHFTEKPLDGIGSLCYNKNMREIIKQLVGMTLQDVELMLILETLKSVDGNRKKAARILRMGERTLYRKITP